MKKQMIDFLLKYLTGSPKDLLLACIDEAHDKHLELAYVSARKSEDRHKVIYLLGGNDPNKCPF